MKQREIKFRYWEKLEKLMYYSDDYIDLEEFWSYAKHDWAISMQYTGLKDKHGKEIYEGDMFDCHYKDESKNHHKWQVVWNNDEAGFGLKRIGKPCNQNVQQKLSDYAGWRGEVIGNIYENKNLMLKN